jgi:hypothetical protein
MKIGLLCVIRTEMREGGAWFEKPDLRNMFFFFVRKLELDVPYITM